MVSARGKGRKERRKNSKVRKPLTALERSWLEGAVSMQALEHAQNLEIEKIKAASKKKFARKITRYTIYRIERSVTTIKAEPSHASSKEHTRVKSAGR
jgi:hypothetical protein